MLKSPSPSGDSDVVKQEDAVAPGETLRVCFEVGLAVKSGAQAQGGEVPARVQVYTGESPGIHR